MLTTKAELRSKRPSVGICEGSKTSSICSSKNQVEAGLAEATDGTPAMAPQATPIRKSRRSMCNSVVLFWKVLAGWGAKAVAEAANVKKRESFMVDANSGAGMRCEGFMVMTLVEKSVLLVAICFDSPLYLVSALRGFRDVEI